MTHDVFISYSSKDKTIADAVCAKLEQLKIHCWIAPRDITAGQNFAKSIIFAIDSCHVFVLIWSSNTNASEHILNEINRAFDRGIPIVPFRIQDVQPTPEMSYYFGRTHWLDAITPPLEDHIGALASTIYALLGRIEPQVPQPAPVVPEPVQEAIALPGVSEPLQPAIMDTPESIRLEEGNIEPKHTEVSARKLEIKKVFIPLLIGIVAVAALAILFTSGGIKAFSPEERAQTSVPTASPTKIPATETPLPAWVSDFSEAILLAIANHPTSFEDYFNQPDTAQLRWGNDPDVSITGGVLHLQATNGETNAGNEMSANNFVISYDFTIIAVAPGTHISLLYRLGEGGNYSLSFLKDGSWSVSPWDPMGTDNGVVISGKIDSMEMNRKYSVILIIKDDKVALYLDDQPAGYGQAEVIRLGQYVGFNLWSPQGTTEVVYDNVRFWDLDHLEP